MDNQINTGFLDKKLNPIYVGSIIVSDQGKRYLVCMEGYRFFIRDLEDPENEQFLIDINDNILDDCILDI